MPPSSKFFKQGMKMIKLLLSCCITHLSSSYFHFFSSQTFQWRAVMSSATSGQLVWLCDLSSNPLLVQTKKNPKSHKSIKGNNSKQQQGSQDNDPGLLLLKGGESRRHMLFFIPLFKAHFNTCHQSTDLCLCLIKHVI